MSDATDLPEAENTGQASQGSAAGGNGDGSRLIPLPIEDELKSSYLTYAMSVIVSRALPDVRDGLKPSQRRILVAMNDLNLTPGAARVKCAKICGDTSGNYHPHGESVIYPTLVRMAQEWNMRYVLIDKQGNFGSIAGLPPAAMRYTEARLSPYAAMMLEDLDLDTVDFVPTYDERRLEPTVLPSKFPNLLVNGATGIAVGMSTEIPPHNLTEICDALIALIDDPEITIDELMEIVPGPDFPTGGIICGRRGIRQGYLTGHGTIVIRARAVIEEYRDNRYRIIIKEIPFQQQRDKIEERIAELVTEGKIPGIANIRNESDLKEPVRIVLELKREADPEIVLNQLYEYSPLQQTYSINLLALVDGKPRLLNFKELLQEFVRHRVTVIRRKTQHLLSKARQRKHTVEGLLLALANIDEVIRVIRTSETQAQAKERLMAIPCPAAMLARALGEEGFAQFQKERGIAEEYFLTPVQADAILRMTLGHLVNLEQEKLVSEHRNLLENIKEYNRILSDEKNILEIIKQELTEIKDKYGDPRRTEISDQEVGAFNIEELIPDEMMVVSISSAGYIKRTPVSAYRAQRRGGKGLKGARVDDEDPIEHVFLAGTHDYLLFFTNLGRVHWRKVYELPELPRDAKGRAIVNLLSLQPDEKVAACRPVRDFSLPDHYLLFATARGLVKKTALSAYGRPVRGGIIAIKLREGDELVGAVVTKKGDEVLLATEKGMAIRFRESDVRPMGRAAAGVKGISLIGDDRVVGLVVAEPDACLLTVCAHGYGKRTPIGASTAGPVADEEIEKPEDETEATASDEEVPEEETSVEEPEADESEEAEEGEVGSQFYYRTQRRGGKGIRDIKTDARNGPVVGVAVVHEDDEILMMTAKGKTQRLRVSEIRLVGRNTKGVRLMTLDEGDTVVAVKRIPAEPGNSADNRE
ncbi:DNA gyrase subunit A [Thermogutta terrifontis]|jgi:DNA gyrase subunit A|uniref:DNA gyrase subunit A n=1 Tax=Thermogutta terrifontis TaxID=1331910 RepID=A0A286RJN5_9BACT|nr:DNA gyrase subunit A [Thermogutta terrifontis]ASV76178.1 DNA gyrase subunit A [Thermogutta terrifontis]